jgi:hypothetical protein
MYSTTENIYCSQLSSVAILLQPELNCFTSYNTRKGLGSLSLSAIVSRSSPPSTRLLVTVNEARSYFGSTKHKWLAGMSLHAGTSNHVAVLNTCDREIRSSDLCQCLRKAVSCKLTLAGAEHWWGRGPGFEAATNKPRWNHCITVSCQYPLST